MDSRGRSEEGIGSAYYYMSVPAVAFDTSYYDECYAKAYIRNYELDEYYYFSEEYKEQEENQYELLETKKYTLELFEKRNSALREKMKQCEKQIWETECNMPEEIDYAERIVALEDAIKALRDESMSIEEKNRFLKKIIDKIEITTFPLPKRSTGCHLKIDLLI
jgi:hypothetical protein